MSCWPARLRGCGPPVGEPWHLAPRLLPHPRQLQKPVVHRFGIEHRDHKTRAAVEKSTSKHIGPHERPRAAPERLAKTAALARCVTLLRTRRRIRVELAQYAFEVLIGVVHQLA